MPKDVADVAKQLGKALAPKLEGTLNKFESITTAIESVTKATGSMGTSIVDSLTGFLGGGDAVSKYFDAIREDGDWLNDWLTHMPKDVANLAKQIGFVIAPQLEGQKDNGKNSVMNVNINSPKALNAREANVVWNRTMKKMQLQW
jgi:hypothetical protein